MISEASIHFHFLKETTLRNRKNLKTFISEIFSIENTPLDAINYIFCDDAYLHKLNFDFLNHDTLTDIVTFPLSAPCAPVLADIYISIDRVKQNAIQFHVAFKSELHRVIFHGALHLCQYKDKSNAQKKLMREKEDHYLAKYFVPRETI